MLVMAVNGGVGILEVGAARKVWADSCHRCAALVWGGGAFGG